MIIRDIGTTVDSDSVYDETTEELRVRLEKFIEQGVRRWIADARIRIEQTRLLVLMTAWLVDTVGNRGVPIEISAIKVAAAELAHWVVDKVILAAAAGVSEDTVLAQLLAHARILRIADAPDAVHRMAVAAEGRRCALVS